MTTLLIWPVPNSRKNRVISTRISRMLIIELYLYCSLIPFGSPTVSFPQPFLLPLQSDVLHLRIRLVPSVFLSFFSFVLFSFVFLFSFVKYFSCPAFITRETLYGLFRDKQPLLKTYPTSISPFLRYCKDIRKCETGFSDIFTTTCFHHNGFQKAPARTREPTVKFGNKRSFSNP